MSQDNNTQSSVFSILELYKNVCKQSTQYAILVRFSIDVMKRIKSINNDEAVRFECEYAINFLETELNEINK
jgi:arginine decarboxylase-like protein